MDGSGGLGTMGLADLRDLAVIDTAPLDRFRDSIVAVDAHNWLYRYLTTIVRYRDEALYTTAGGQEVPNLVGIMQGLPTLLENGLFPVFVFDGIALDLKEAELAARNQRKRQAANEATRLRAAGRDSEARRYEARAQRLTDVILESTVDLLELLDIPTIQAPAEAEAQAAHMARQDDVDYVGTEDYDALLFGAPITLRKLTSSGEIERMDLAKTLETHNITRRQLVAIAILCGTDYNDGVHGIGPKTALEAVREAGSLQAVINDRGLTIEDADAIESIYLEPAVTDEYAFPNRIQPDLEQALEFVTDWELPQEEFDRALERWRACTPLESQRTGVDEESLG